MNAFLCEVGDFEVVIAMSEKKFTPVFMIRDRGSVVSYTYGGGHQKASLGLAARLALARIGAAGHNLRQLFVDEAFVACDAHNLSRIKETLRTVMRYGGYRSVLVISHLDAVSAAADVRCAVDRNGPLSSLRFGSSAKK
jgi:DNA repair exonuclease SbcCD ATPase subunit